MTEDEMVGWHHLLIGHEFEYSAASKMQPSVSESLQGEGQPLSCCDGEAGPVCLVKRKE